MYPILCLNLRRCATLVWSCARARAVQQATRIEWQPYRESKVLNAIYGILFWKEGPGTAEIRQDQKSIETLTEQYFDHTFETFLERSTHGPTVLAHYVDGLISTRQSALESVQEVFRDASEINAEIAEQAHQTVKTLAAIKLASALTLTGVGCYLALTGAGVVLVMQAGLVKLGSDVTGEVIKSHENIGGNIKGIAYQVGKYGLEKRADKTAEHAHEVGEHALKQYQSKLAAAEQRIQRYSVEVARKLKARKAKIAVRRLQTAQANAAAAGVAVKSAQKSLKIAKFAGKAVPVVFAAWDVVDAIKEYQEDVRD